jgi:hypothetical protein
MGYRDDFYVAANVIGYSGNLNDFPSVYFRSASEYGHITEKHPTSQNVGRGIVHPNAGYTIQNVMINGVLKLVEAVNGRVFHESRSTLTSVNGMSDADKAILYQAIWKYPNEKLIDGYADSDFDIIDKADAAHGAAMDLIRARGQK